MSSLLGAALIALDEVLSHKLRAGLSVASIVVGVLTLSLVVAVGEMGRSAAQAVLERQTGRQATLALSVAPVTPWDIDRATWRTHLTDRLAMLGARAVSPLEQVATSIVSRGTTIKMDLVGVDPEFASIRRVRIVSGRWIEAADAAFFAPVVVFNVALANRTGCSVPKRSACSLLLELPQLIVARLVGVVDDGEQIGRGYVVASALDRWASAEESTTLNLVAWVPPTLSSRIASQLKSDAARAGDRADVQRLDNPDAINQTVSLLELGLGAMALLALLSGGMGILNLGLVTVRARSREFALRRALGASRDQIFAAVLLESVVTATAGGVLGIVLAFLITSGITPFMTDFVAAEDLPGFPLAAALAGFLASAALGVAAGSAPAYWATRSTIISALRD